MKRIIAHAKRLFNSYKFICMVFFLIVPLEFIGMFILMTIISVLFFEDPIDEELVRRYMSEEELQIIGSDTLDENVSDNEYLALMVRFMNITCPRRVDRQTQWIGSRVTNKAFTYLYECKMKSGKIDFEKLKKKDIRKLDRKNIVIQRIIRSKRDLIYSFTCPDVTRSIEVVITNDELKAL